MWAEFLAYLIKRFGDAVLNWSVGQLMQKLESDGDPPPEIHGAGCECHQCGTVFDDDELGIDPEGEGWEHGR